MTTDIIELSKQVAEVLKVPAFSVPDPEYPHKLWLAEDAGRCAEIAANKMIDIRHDDDSVQAVWNKGLDGSFSGLFSYLANHNNERIKAYCVAVCKAILEQAKQS